MIYGAAIVLSAEVRGISLPQCLHVLSNTNNMCPLTVPAKLNVTALTRLQAINQTMEVL